MSDTQEALQNNDIRFLAVAAEFTDADWARQSLCREWTNHEVLAHLVDGYSLGPTAVLSEMMRRGGSFNHANTSLACARAAQRDPATLLEDLAERSKRPQGLGRVFPRRLLLGDHVIHELDIVLPLGLQPTIPPSCLTAVLDTQVTVPNPFVPARARASGLRLVADDIGWNHGSGPTVSGPAASLVSVLAGRSWALDSLHGDGLATLFETLP